MMKKQVLIFATAILFIVFPNAQSIKAQTNTATGIQALQFNTSGVNNTATGYRALRFNTIGSFNTAHGAEALLSNTIGNQNTAIGVRALLSNTTGGQNTATGVGALSSNTTGGLNTASGVAALTKNTTGSQNTGTGFGALFSNTTGANNTASGNNALALNTTGSFNTASGSVALQENTTGNNNTASGYSALLKNTTGSNNTANGVEALNSNTTGFDNTATGVGALRFNTTGSNNTAHGVGALGAASSFISAPGSFNTAVGNKALFGVIAGNANTAIGAEAGSGHPFIAQGTFLGTSTGISTGERPPPGLFVNVTAVGYQARVTSNNQVRIGNTAVTSIGGQVSWTAFSDGRYKKNLNEDVPGLAFITQLRPVTYTLDVESIDNKLSANLPQVSTEGGSEVTKAMTNQKPSAEEIKAKTEKAKIKYTGFVAQEVEKAAKKLNYDFSGVDAPKNKEGFYGLRYAEFVVPLVRSVQELDAENKELKKDVEDLKELVAKLINEKAIGGNNTTANLSGAYLEPNRPNPFKSTTVIRYHLPQSAGAANVVITNMKGQILKSIALTSKGDGQVTLNAGTLAAGSYTYSLWVEGKQIDAKQMLIIK